MSANTKLSVPFTLRQIKTIQFATFDQEICDTEKINLESAVTFKIDSKNRFIGVFNKFSLYQNEKVLLVIEANCNFEIEKNGWDSLVNKDEGTIILPSGLAQHLAVLTVGTTRGILHAKTEGTPFNRFFLPTIDVTKLVKDNVKFKTT